MYNTYGYIANAFNYQYSKKPCIISAIIYFDYQINLKNIKDFNKIKSKQYLVPNIMKIIDEMQNTGAKIKLHWFPADVDIADNKKEKKQAKCTTEVKII